MLKLNPSKGFARGGGDKLSLTLMDNSGGMYV